MEDLSYLLEPIALYPDPLLALILSASTFPVQIVEAERWIAFNPISVRRGDFSEVDAMDWDSSVKALARFPDVIRMLADHLDWTESLGTAVAMQASDVTTAIQLLRAKAETLGKGLAGDLRVARKSRKDLRASLRSRDRVQQFCERSYCLRCWRAGWLSLE